MKPFYRLSSYLLFIPIITVTMALHSISYKEDKEVTSQGEIELDNIRNHKAVPKDMVLIYDGGAHRSIKWDKDHFSPYIYSIKEGEHKLLFDGFLFLEIKDGNGRGFASGYEKLAARKIEWENLLQNYFTENNAIDALNARVEDLMRNQTIAGNYEKRKVIISIPEPIPNQKDWGKLENRELDFSNGEDRIAACKWYIEYAEQLFKKADFEYLELVGFYWLAEEATNSRDLAKYIADIVYQKGYDFYWIPYFNSDGYQEWKRLGFNQVYYQPNYFFNENVPYSQLEEACKRAKIHGMNMEVEFDERVLAKNGWGYRLDDYLDVFAQYEVLDSLNIAYYQGGDAFFRLSQSQESSDIALYNRLTDMIIKRQKQQ